MHINSIIKLTFQKRALNFVSDNNQFTKFHKPNFSHYHFKTFGGGGIL